jgi:hypothetical protein
VTRGAVIGRKRPVTDGIEKIFFRPTMGIMTGRTGIGPGLDPTMTIEKLRCLRFVALRTNLTACNQGQGSIVRTVRAMADRAIFRCGWVQGTVPPILCYFAVTTQTKCRLVLIRVAGMG